MGIIFDDKGGLMLERVILLVIAVPIVVWLLFSVFVIIPAGNRGVVLAFGSVEPRILDAGLHTLIPVQEQAVTMSVQTQKYEALTSAASTKDLLDVSTDVVVNYHIDPAAVNKLYQNVGLDYEAKVIQPAVQEVVKATTAKHNAEELITQRETVKGEIQDALATRLANYNIIVEQIAITNFQFPSGFNDAIVAKQVAQQNVLTQQNILSANQVQAQQAVALAQGQATAIALLQQQLAKSPLYVQYYALTKWNGILPAVTGGNVPFIQISAQDLQNYQTAANNAAALNNIPTLPTYNTTAPTTTTTTTEGT